ncbi:MAG: hypothetical protein OXH22_06060 [Chloroflexi bacterium]|nr:hypothetical protein [Chloroflexota bacterium]
MTWLEQHRLSEQFASDAEVAKLRGEYTQAQELYTIAAQHEEAALEAIAYDKRRTYGIIAVSAVALRFKAAEFAESKMLAYRCLASQRLPEFAWRQIEDMLESIKKEQSGVSLDDAQMLVSLKGGAILYGGAPLDLIVEKSQKMRSLVYRTVEYLKNVPHRRRGEPSREIKSSYRPWIFQAEPGSYQFTLSIQEISQLKMNLFDTDEIHPEQIVGQLFHILQACSESPEEGLTELVRQDDYRLAFLKLARDLTPTPRGKEFTQLDVRTASAPRSLGLNINTRYAINEVIRANLSPLSDEQAIEVHGVLRALSLDNDWIQVVQENGESVRINRAGEEIDDRIGQMVNHPVIVQAAKSVASLRFLDIELAE